MGGFSAEGDATGLAHIFSAMAAMPAASRPLKASLPERLGLTARAVEGSLFTDAKRFGKSAVQGSDDLARILALPRRPRPDTHVSEALMEGVTSYLTRYNSHCACAPAPCIKRLLPVQAWYLDEAHDGGGVGHIIVGGGKTGIDILLPMVIPGVKRAVLLIPSSLRAQFKNDYLRWSQHFRVPNLA